MFFILLNMKMRFEEDFKLWSNNLEIGCSLDKSLISSILWQYYLQYRLLPLYFDICYQLNI